MHEEAEDVDVYGLITRLVEHTLDKYRVRYRDFYALDTNDTGPIKRLRSRAYGILLNKTSVKDAGRPGRREKGETETEDPIAELFKHAFVLRLGFRRALDACALEKLAEELSVESEGSDRILSTLRFLIRLKNSEPETEPITNIFHYGKANPLLPEIPEPARNVPMFQVCPIESFVLVDKFQATLRAQRYLVDRNLLTTPGSELRFNGGFRSQNAVKVESYSTSVNGFLSSPAFSGSLICLPLSPSEYNSGRLDLDLQPLPEIMAYESNRNVRSVKRSSSNYFEGPYTTDLVPVETENIFEESSDDGYSEDLDHDTPEVTDLIWSSVDPDEPACPNYRTWESFGQEPLKEPAFMTDVPNVMIHLARVKETSSLSLLPPRIIEDVPLIEEIPVTEFLNDIKSLLFGVESSCFTYDPSNGFSIRRYISVYGVSPDTLEIVCQSAIQWGNCFKFITELVTPDSQTGKLRQDGLIFKTMCTNIKELLLYYRATVLRILARQERSQGLLRLLGSVRPVAKLIVEVARLCGSGNRERLHGEGNVILTRIYKHAIEVTDPRVALVFYSILKSCCEVYFRFLQKWMFEGICDDEYGEFMIKTRPQYLRNRGHKFWTKSFTVCNEAVPGFLSDLTESILRCGKTVRLLRICDLRNPVCSLSISDQPEVKVCLSVAMLNEQLARCRGYEERGKSLLGPCLSLASAIQQRKDHERETARLVIRAHQDTLARIDDEREESSRRIARAKHELMENLRQQLVRADSRPARKEENQDYFLERFEKPDARRKERTAVVKYYEELAVDIEKRRARAQWRMKRMSHYEERVTAIASGNRLLTKVREESLEKNADCEISVEEDETKLESCKIVESKSQDCVENEASRSSIEVKTDKGNLENKPGAGSTEGKMRENLKNESNTESMEGKMRENLKNEPSTESREGKMRENLKNESNTESTEGKMRENLENKPSMESMEGRINENVKNKTSTESMEGRIKENVKNKPVTENVEGRIKENVKSKPVTENVEGRINENVKNKPVTENVEGRINENIKNKPVTENIAGKTNENIKNKPVTENIEGKILENLKNVENSELKISETISKVDNSTNLIACVPPVFEDENKNITETERSQKIETETQRTTTESSQPSYVNRRNNERSDFQSFLKEETLRNLQARIFEKTVDNRSKAIETTIDANTIETDNRNNRRRPNYLNFNLNNLNNRAQRIYDMTPNNNQLHLPVLEDNATIETIKNLDREDFDRPAIDLETPMSCTTDKYTSSMPSPLSLLGQSEQGSSIDITNDAKSSCSRFTVSPGTMARSTTSLNRDLFSLFRLTPDEKGPSVPPLTFDDVDMIDHTSLQVYLEKSIRIPLRIQSRLVNNAVIKYFLQEHDLLLHLHSLRSYFFLLNGEFAKSMTDSLYARLYEISAPVELFNTTTLQNLLERAFVNSFSNSYVNSEHLSLSAVDTPNELRISDPSALDCLTLNYKISWPLNIILDEMVMLQYGKVFKFLITSGRVSWVLQEDFNLMKRERKAAKSEQYHKLQLYRHSMTQFMNALHNYITCSVLHSSWAEFERDLQNSMTLDEIYSSHVNYIKRILSRCMLNARGEKMRVCLSNIFKVILKFHNRLRSRLWTPRQTSYVHPNFKKLEQMYRAFCELRGYMAHVAHKLATSGYQPHLMHFLNALNINNNYDLTVKPGRNDNEVLVL